MFTSRSNGARVVTSRPWRTTRPAVGCSKPAIIRSVVVLPEPDGPSIEKNSPSRDLEVDARRPRRPRRTASRGPRAARPAVDGPAAEPGDVAGAGAPCSCAWSSTWACGSPVGRAVRRPGGARTCGVRRHAGLPSPVRRERAGRGVGAPAFPVPSAARSGAHARWRRAAVSSDLRPAVSGAVSRIMAGCTPSLRHAAVAGAPRRRPRRRLRHGRAGRHAADHARAPAARRARSTS